MAMNKIQYENKGMTTAIEGDIKGAYDNVNFGKLEEILKRKIDDKKFMRLMLSALHCGYVEFGKMRHNITGVPQGGIASPILLNIYMHEFDKEVIRRVSEMIEEKNYEENRTAKPGSDTYRRVKHMIGYNERSLRDIRQVDPETGSAIYSNKEEYLVLRKELRKWKRMKSNTKSISQYRRSIFFSYTRYADDWIILTNADVYFATEIKEALKEWLNKELKLELSEEFDY